MTPVDQSTDQQAKRQLSFLLDRIPMEKEIAEWNNNGIILVS